MVAHSAIRGWAVIFAALLVLYILLQPTTEIRGSSKWFCARFETESAAATYVWSHRGHADGGNRFIDGSSEAQLVLIKGGVTRFDVDCSFLDDIFYIAHPSVIEKLDTPRKRKDLQTLDSFLSNLSKAPATTRLVTIEPKFDDSSLWSALLDKLTSSEVATSTAIVLNEPSQLALVEAYYSDRAELRGKGPQARISVAIAYRSLPKTPHDWSWKADNSASEGRLLQHSDKFRSIAMPDVKLLAPSNQKRRRGSAGLIIVPWLVDDEASLIKAIMRGDDGVVSNKPLSLRSRLVALYAEKCGKH